MIAAFLVIEAVIIVACTVVALWAQQRFDLAARFLGRLAESMGARWFTERQPCRGCERVVHLMRFVRPIGYRCLRCTAPAAPGGEHR